MPTDNQLRRRGNVRESLAKMGDRLTPAQVNAFCEYFVVYDVNDLPPFAEFVEMCHQMPKEVRDVFVRSGE